MNTAAILAAAATAATITLGAGAHVGAQTASTCILAVHPWDGLSRRLEVETTAGTQVLLSVQDNRTALGGERIFELDASTIRRVNWTWNRQESGWRVSLAVVPGACQMEPYPFWQDGSHPASISMGVGQVPTTTVRPTTTTAPPATTTTAAPATTTTAAPATTTTAPPATTTTTSGRPLPLTLGRVTPIPDACAPDACAPALTPTPRAPQLPATGRHTWPQVRLALGLMAVGVAAIAMSVIMRQDDEMETQEDQ